MALQGQMYVLIIGRVKEDKENKRSERVCEEHACLRSSKTHQNMKTLVQLN